MTPEEIAALKAGDKITVEVEKVTGRIGDGVGVCFTGSRTRYFFALEELAHVTRTPAPEPPLAIGEPVMFDGERWEVAAPPRTRDDGREQVALWNEIFGYRYAFVSSCTPCATVTPARIKELRALVEAASPSLTDGTASINALSGLLEVGAAHQRPRARIAPRCDEDAALTELPALLDEVERLRGAFKTAIDELEYDGQFIAADIARQALEGGQ